MAENLFKSKLLRRFGATSILAERSFAAENLFEKALPSLFFGDACNFLDIFSRLSFTIKGEVKLFIVRSFTPVPGLKSL